MNRPAGRVLTLLELLQSGGLRTASELAERLGVDTRTVRRYVEHLLDLDIPVESVRGRYGGYRLARGYRLPPLMLGDDEALAVLLGLLAGRRSGLTAALGPAGETASAKIRRVLPARLADRLQGVLDSVAFTEVSATSEGSDQGEALDAAVLLTVADAVAGHRPIAVAYTDRDGVRTERALHPYAIVSHRDRWYIRALDQKIGEERTFRLDRIDSARTLPGPFEPPADGDPAQSLVTGFATADYRYDVRLRVYGTIEQIRRRLPASVAVFVEENEAGEEESGRPASSDRPAALRRPATSHGPAAWHRLAIRAEHLDWLPGVLAVLDLPFEIERPRELRDRVLALAERLAARARAGTA